MDLPRYVHGPDGAHRLVRTPAECSAALGEGWRLTPVLTSMQEAAVRAARIRAGELSPDEDGSAAPDESAGSHTAEPINDAPAPVEAALPPEPPKKRGRPRKA